MKFPLQKFVVRPAGCYPVAGALGDSPYNFNGGPDHEEVEYDGLALHPLLGLDEAEEHDPAATDLIRKHSFNKQRETDINCSWYVAQNVNSSSI